MGGTSLLGQYIIKSLEESPDFSIYITVRKINARVINFYSPKTKIVQFEFKINEVERIQKIIKEIKPDIIINCIISLNKSEVNFSEMILTNSFFPQHINDVCRQNLDTYFFIQISSDAVFDGQAGNFSENNHSLPLNFYGLTKLAGELQGPNCLNIRTSFYGPNLLSKNKTIGFFDWALNTNEVLSGFKNYFFSGLSTIRLADEIKNILIEDEIRGTLHIAAQRISKLELLLLINENSNKKEILICGEPRVNMTLVSNYRPNYSMTHEEMVQELFTFLQLH